MNTLPPESPASDASSSEKRARELVRLALGRLDSYASTGSDEDLRETFSCIDRALAEVSATDPLKGYLLHNVSVLLRERQPAACNEAIVRKSIALNDEFLSGEPVGSEAYLGALTNRGNAYRQLHTLTRDAGDLQESIRTHELAVGEALARHADRAMMLSNYGNALRQRFEVNRDPRDLDKAIDVQTEAAGSASLTEEEAALVHFTLAISLFGRYEVARRRDDLARSVTDFRTAVSLTPRSSPDLPLRLLRLAFALIRDFEASLQGPSLGEAIGALDSIPPGALDPESRVSYLNARSISFRLRYDQSGSIRDLERAIDAMRQYLPPVEQARGEHRGDLGDLACMLDELDLRTGKCENLTEARRLLLRAIELSGEDPALAARSYHNLANVLTGGYDGSLSLETLCEAISYRERAIGLTLQGSHELAVRVVCLARDRGRLAARNHDMTQLESAIEEMRSATTLAMQTTLDRAIVLHALSTALAEYSQMVNSPSAALESVRLAREAAALAAPISASIEFISAAQWAYLAARHFDWDQAADAFREALRAHDDLFEVQTTASHKAKRLEYVVDMHPFAAYAFAKVGDAEGAALALEKGRARLLADALAHSTDELADLRVAAPELAAEIAACGDRLGRLQARVLLPMDTPHPSTMEHELAAAEGEWRALVQQVRLMPGFESFRRPGSAEEIGQAASLKPIVYIAPSYLGGLSVFVAEGRPPRVILLPELSLTRLHGCLARATANLYATGDFLGSIDQVCQWLWDSVMGPVTTELLSLGHDECVLIPFGLLGILPLHAAWCKDSGAKGGRLYASDRATFAYAPSARALVATNGRRNLQMPSVLAIEDPTCDLIHANKESAAVLSHFSVRQLLGGLAATKEAVFASMGQFSVVHFACHAAAVASDPMASALFMAGGETLTLGDIAGLSLPVTRMVVLSACETGLIGRDLLDESMGFPSAFLGLGVPAVVSSIWAVDDESTSILMQHFYDNLVLRGLPPHRALRAAQIALRDGPSGSRDFSHPFFWASFFITGL